MVFLEVLVNCLRKQRDYDYENGLPRGFLSFLRKDLKTSMEFREHVTLLFLEVLAKGPTKTRNLKERIVFREQSYLAGS